MDITGLLNEYLTAAGNTVPTPDPKQVEVLAASEAKKANLRRQGYRSGAVADTLGNENPGGFWDILEQTPEEIAAGVRGRGEYSLDATADRSTASAVGDNLNSALTGAMITIPQIANIGVDAVSPNAGAVVTRFLQEGLDNANAKKSYGYQGQSRANAARNQITSERNAQLQKEELEAGSGKFAAGLRRIGRDSIDAVSNIDTISAEDLIANAAGSLLTSGPLGEATGLAGKAALRAGMKSGVVGFSGARNALTVGSKLNMPINIGLQEAGGVHHQTANNILNMSHEELAANSPDYQQAIAEGLSPDDARNLVARNAGLEAAAITFPVAAAAGTLVGQFEKAPLRVNSLLSAAGNTIKEGVEEGIQSGAGQIAQNIATRDNANENQDLLEGVGNQIGLGALGGVGSGGLTSAPGAVLKTAADLITGTADLGVQGVKAVAGVINDRFNKVTEANEAASPVSDENVRSAVDLTTAAAPDFAAAVGEAVNETKADDTQKAQATDYVNTLVGAVNITPEELDDPRLPENLRQILTGSTDRLDAVQRLAKAVQDSPDGSVEQLTAAATLYFTMGAVDDALAQGDVGALDELDPKHPAREMVDNYQNVLSSIRQSTSVANALDRFDQTAKAANENGELKPVDEAQLATPEGQQAVRNTIAVAENSPLNANPEANDQILRHAEAGKIQLTTPQKMALQASNSLVRAQRDRLAELERLGLKSNSDVVTEDILTRDAGQETKTPSLREHVRRIIEASKSGDTEGATEYLNNLVRFAQHMQNKVAAYNTALETGATSDKNAVKFNALMRGGKFRPVGKVYVNPYTPGGVQMAQQVASDAAAVGRVANDLAQAFAELGVKPVDLAQLHETLTAGTADEVSQAYREGRAKSGQTTQAQVDQVSNQQEAEPVPAPEPEVKSENKADTQIELPLDQKVEDASTTPEPEATGQPEGGDQSAETETTETPDRRTELNDKAKKDYLTVDENAERRTLNEAAEEQVQSPTVEEKQEAGPAAEDAPAQTEADAGGEVEAAKPEPAAEPEKVDNLTKLPKWSWLKKLYRLPAEPKTRIIGTGSPFEVIKKALSSADALTPEIASAYVDYIESNGTKLKAILADRLAKGKEKARFLSGDARMIRVRNGKVLHTTEEVDGDLVYNQELLESAVLAALQWMLVADHFQTKLETDDVADIFEIPREDFYDKIPDPNNKGQWLSLVDQMNNGLGLIEAKRSLARMIEDYWGLSPKSAAPAGQVSGVAEAMAAEMLFALEDARALTKTEWQVTSKNGLPEGQTKDTIVFEPITKHQPKDKRTHPLQDPEYPLYAFPDAIDQAVLTNPEPVTFIGEAPTKVAKTQHHNPLVEITEQQTAAIAFEQKQEHFANLPAMNLLTTGLGMDNMLRLFAAGDLSKVALNRMDRKSKDGLNLTFKSAFLSLQKLMTELKHKAGEAGVDMDQLPIFYDYVFNRFNRMQMQGPNNPQASKLMREAVLATKATIDLSSQNSEHFGNFAIGLAQALGVKIHQVSREEAINKVLTELNGSRKEAVELLQNWVSGEPKPLTDNQVDTLAAGLGKDSTPVALHALTEYARYLNADQKGRQAFTTSLYVEADGVTNGPGNAMVLLTPGVFTLDWLKRVRKVGLFPGARGRSMNDHRQVDPNDHYKVVSFRLGDLVADLRAKLRNEAPSVKDGVTSPFDQMHHLNELMGMFMPGDVTLDGENLTFERGIAKNPMTISIYGSGVKGIAGKVSHALAEAIYERLSLAMQGAKSANAQELANAMFPKAVDDADARKKYNQFLKSINALTTNVIKKVDGEYVLEKGEKTPDRNFHPETFELDISELNNLKQNMRYLFVEPMRDAIRETVGDGIMHPERGSATLLRQAIQIQSIFRQHLFNKYVEEALKEKAKDPEWAKGDFLSLDEQREIAKRVIDEIPMIDSGAQRLLIGSTESADIANQHFEFGSSFGDRYRTPAYINGFANAGVAGIPGVTISMGDGLAMQVMSTMDGAPDRTVKIFDGVHLPLDALVEGSQKANEAIFQSWMGNPMQNVSDSFSGSLEALVAANLNEALLKELDKALNIYSKSPSPELIQERIQQLNDRVRQMALDIESKHRALSRIGLSVDQMAGVGAPYVHEGEVSLEGLSDEQVIAELNRLGREEYQKLKNPEAGPETKAAPVEKAEKAEAPKRESKVKKFLTKAISQDITTELESVGRVLKSSGVRVISHTALNKLMRSLSIPSQQKEVLREVLRTLTAGEYKILYGTPEQVADYAAERGLNFDIEAKSEADVTDGFFDPVSNTIVLHTATSEILLHELIHAATIDKVHAYYNGRDLGPNAAAQVQAIQRIEQLMQQFLGLYTQMGKEDQATQDAYFNATDEIEFRLAKGDRASALNEFMAWALANSQLQKLTSKTEANPLVRLARKVVALIKRLVAGRRHMSLAGEDIFSTLRFNTNVLLQTKVDARQRFANTILFHSSSYGSNDRLAEINQTLYEKVFRHLDKTVFGPDYSEGARKMRLQAEVAKLASSTDVVLDVIDSGFTMAEQERSTFQALVSTLKTSVELDPNALNGIQALYAHVTKTLKVEDFMEDPNSPNQGERYLANEKFNIIMGNYPLEKDAKGRSSLLPVFLALATVNEEFRAILAKMDVPAPLRRNDQSLDALVDNSLNAAMDHLNSYVSGQPKNAPHVQAAVDALLQRVLDTAADRETFMQRTMSPIGAALEAANQWTIDAMQSLAKATIKKTDEIKAKTDNKLVQAAASLGRFMAGVIDENTGAEVGEGLISRLNRGKFPKAFQEFASDVVGRTDSNASVYDLIKQANSIVQRQRQQFRQDLPEVINGRFSRKLTDVEQTAMFNGFGKTDLAVLRQKLTRQEVLDIIEDPRDLADQVDKLEQELQLADPDWQLIQKKAKQLAHYMNTGEYGTNLLRNATTVANLFNEGKKRSPASDALIKVVDQLTTLYAFDGLAQETKDTLASLVQDEAEGVNFILDYMVGLRKDELAKATRNGADVNHFKGAMPVEYQHGMTLVVASDKDHAKMVGMSFIRLGDYRGSNLDRGLKKGYYFAPVSGKSPFSQGIMQTVRPTAYGIDLASGFSHGLTAGRIEDPVAVKKITQRLSRENGAEPLSPLFDSNGKVIAYERTVDPKQLERLNRQTDLSKTIGIWGGRQIEELEAQWVNEALIDRLHDMWEKDSKDPVRKDEYVDIRDPAEWKKDPVLGDAVKLFSADIHEYIDGVFGKRFMVRRDLLNDSVGYRAASVGDLWTGNSRLPANVVNGAHKAAVAIFGNKAYRYMVNAEKMIQNLVLDARMMIVVRSVIVPAANLLTNIYQLASNGVPWVEIFRGLPRKAAEVSAYLKSAHRLNEADAELRAAAGDQKAINRLEAEIQSIKDEHRRLSIWPLIEAGEFSSISDGTLTHEELELSDGRLSEWIEKKVDQLPEGAIRQFGKYAVISRDTALFKALQQSVEYGDFLAKAVLYDHLTKRKSKSQSDALGHITDEFVNYPKLPGRSRGFLESMGVLWFYNFKIRSTKVALRLIRNNPVHALLSTVMPHPEMFGSVGSPMGDNVFTMAANGDLDWSIGPGMGLRSPTLSPWVNLIN